MRWKIYFWFFAISGISSVYTIFTNPAYSSANLPFVYVDYVLSAAAACGLFFFAYGKKAVNSRSWQILAGIFIGYDVIINLTVRQITSNHAGVLADTLVLIMGFILTMPAYIAIILYSQGKINSIKKAAVKHSAGKPDKIVYFQKSPTVVALSSFFTYNIYSVYWFYKQWQTANKNSDKKLNPLLGAIFNVYSSLPLYTMVQNSAKQHGYKSYYNGRVLAVIYIILGLVAGTSTKIIVKVLPSEIIRFLLTVLAITFCMSLILFLTQKAANFSNSKVLGKKAQQQKASVVEKIFITVGVIFFIATSSIFVYFIATYRTPIGTSSQIQQQKLVLDDTNNKYDACAKEIQSEYDNLDTTNGAAVDAYNLRRNSCEEVRLQQNAAAREYNRLLGY